MSDTRDDELPINPRTVMSDQSKQALMIAEDLGLLTYRMPIDMTVPAQVETIRGELGPDAVLPDDHDGVYYFVYVESRDGSRTPVLLAEGEPRSFVLALAVLEGEDTARRVLYRRSLLPQ
jgi:hypothetical protein